MRGAGWAAGLLLALLTGRAAAGTAYVSDELVLGVYSEQNGQGQRLTTLHSGASVETLSVDGESTQVRLGDGTAGWVKSSYLTTQEPAAARVKQLQEELDRSRATTPALAEAAARSELEQLKREIKLKQSELDAARGALAAPASAVDPATSGSATRDASAAGAATPEGAMAGVAVLAAHAWMWILSLLVVLGCGFWLGYATLARRVKHRFGGIKVY